MAFAAFSLLVCMAMAGLMAAAEAMPASSAQLVPYVPVTPYHEGDLLASGSKKHVRYASALPRAHKLPVHSAQSYSAPSASGLPPSYPGKEPGDKSKITGIYKEGDTTTLEHAHPPERKYIRR